MKMFTATLVSLFAATTMAATKAKIEPGTYAIDGAHSTVGFSIKHLVISEVEGRFDKFDGEITLAEKITAATVTANIDTTSINTANAKRDEHLKSADFFDTAKFPTMTFKSKKVTGSVDNMTIVGDLTLHGVTKEVTLKGKMTGTIKGMMGETRAAFNATTTIKRSDFGLTWSKAVEAGPVVGEEVKVTLKLEATKNEQPGKKS